MSLMITVKFPVSADVMEKIADDHREMLMSISEDGRRLGCLHHAFAEDTDGSWLVIDEWPDEESFQRFFAEQEDIPKIVTAAGITSEPTVTVYRVVDTPDRF